MTTLIASAPADLRRDPVDGDHAPLIARISGDGSSLESLTTQLFGEQRELLAGPAGPDGAADTVWSLDGFTLRAVVTAQMPGVSFFVPLAALERVVDGNVTIHRWDCEAVIPALTPVGHTSLRFAVRRVVHLQGDGAVSSDGLFTARLPVGVEVEIAITVRWPLISSAESYTTRDGREQLWRSVVPPDLGDRPVPLIVALHGGNNTADNVLGLSNPSMGGGLKAVTAMALGAVLIAPNANNATQVESNNGPDDVGDELYQGRQKGDVFDAIEAACQRWPIDRNRIYLVGISMGGHGSLVLAAQHPDRFAAVVSVVPPCDFALLWEELPHIRGLLERTFGGSPASAPSAYLQGSALHLADNLLHTAVVVRGASQDELVPGEQHAGRLASKLAALGYHADVTINDEGHHVDYDTVEGAFERALPLLLQRPKLQTDPESIVYRTADPGVADGAWWLHIRELRGPGFGHVEARVDGERIVVWATNVARLHIDRAGDVELHADGPCVLER